MKNLKSFIIGVVIILVAIFVVIFLKTSSKNPVSEPTLTNLKGGNMKLSSDAFTDGGFIPKEYTCDGLDKAPLLKIEEVPEGTVSLALIVDDPDAPRGDFVHWLVWNLPADTKEIDANNLPPQTVQGRTDFGKNAYGGPCPPSGVHRYQFKLYALDQDLNLPSSSTKADLLKAMEGHILEQVVLVGKYSRGG